jgi:hypothetical protein
MLKITTRQWLKWFSLLEKKGKIEEDLWRNKK